MFNPPVIWGFELLEISYFDLSMHDMIMEQLNLIILNIAGQ